ncbi:hypothetical protein [Adhaeribacter terreus]|uniref:hypothetical protein n=1 Tax=Adhaeribacter terreus TaxID=529703 RepID=UPI00366F04C3
MTIDLINNLLSDIANFHFVIFGIALSLFTVLFSFILNKREELRGYSERIKLGEESISLFQKNQAAKNFIKKLKRVNFHIIIIIFISLIMYVLVWIVKNFLINNFNKLYLFYILSALSILIFIYVFSIIIKVILDYNRLTKI